MGNAEEYTSDEELAFLHPKQRDSNKGKTCVKVLGAISLLTSLLVLIMVVARSVSVQGGFSNEGDAVTLQSLSTTFGQLFRSQESSSSSDSCQLTTKVDGGFGYGVSDTNEVIECGNTMESALKNGCVFDEMLNGWVPSACHNETMAQEALRDNTELAELQAAGHFPWYEDLQFTRPIKQGHLTHYLQDEVSKNSTEDDLRIAYTWEKWHTAHCLYVWRLSMLAMNRIRNGEKDVYANTRIIAESHVSHCNHVIADRENRVGAKSVVYFGYGKCIKMA